MLVFYIFTFFLHFALFLHLHPSDFFAVDPLKYKQFNRHFETYTIRKCWILPLDLTLLIASRNSEAKHCIKNCIMSEFPNAGYCESTRILRKNYGEMSGFANAYS